MRRARRSTIVLTAVFVLSAFVAISAIMMLLASPASVQKEMIQYKALMDSQVAFRLTWWRWPAKARQLYADLEPQVADVDWSLPMATYDEAMARLMFRMDDTSESRFFELSGPRAPGISQRWRRDSFWASRQEAVPGGSSAIPSTRSSHHTSVSSRSTTCSASGTSGSTMCRRS